MPSIKGWYRPSSACERVFLRSEVFAFPCHYPEHFPKSCRCPGFGCELCAFTPLEDRGIVVIQAGPMRELFLLEIRDRNKHLLAELFELGEDLVGMPLWVWIDTTEHGRPIELSLDKPDFAPRSQSPARLDLKRVQARNYISKIGTSEYRRACSLLPSPPSSGIFEPA